MTILRMLTLLIILAVTLSGCTAASNASTVEPVTIRLTKPAGENAVGVIDLHLKDPTRPSPDGTPGRDIMVTIWYPANPDTTDSRATWMPDPTERYLAEQLQATANVPAPSWRLGPLTAESGVTASRNAQPELVLLSPGYGMLRGLYAGLAQDLASNGYVVITVDHPGDAGLVTLPDGRVQAQLSLDQDDPDAVQAAVADRAVDLRFVLDEVQQFSTESRRADADGQPLPANLARLLDTTHTVGVGHSFGGPAVLQAMITDKRIDTAINLDGSLYPPVNNGVNRPVLLVGSDGHNLDKDPSWQRWCASANPPSEAVVLPGAAHLSFTDLTTILPALGQASLAKPASVINTIGSLDPVESQQAQTDLVLSWLSEGGQPTARRTAVPAFQALPACRVKR